MRLTRRDALAALTAAGVTAGAGVFVLSSEKSGPSNEETSEHELEDATVRTLVAAAEVLYPSEVENVESFVNQYVRGKVADRPAHGSGIEDAVTHLDDYAMAWYDTEFADLDPATREDALDRMSADTLDPVPDGSDGERVRYYVVNDLLYALYTTPTGGELVGLENPRGHPGGIDSYRRGPRS
ncbi:MAG: gluconate 2-dehydrogenase subunit 3 family protein [archaeon]